MCLVTPLRDGMNLVAKEFVASQDDDPGVVVLSKFCGAAETMRDALIVNPHDISRDGEDDLHGSEHASERACFTPRRLDGARPDVHLPLVVGHVLGRAGRELAGPADTPMSTQNRLAIDGGAPVRAERLPFFRVSYGHEEREEVLDVFERGVFGSVYPDAVKVRALEEAFAEYVGTAHAVAFSSGTTAQHASLVAAGVGPGDEVIVPPLTFASTAYTVLMVGATPVFADVDDETITLDPKHVAEAVTSRTRVIVPVHWFGVPAAMDELMEVAAARDIVVIEDCAHAYGTAYRGRKAGTIGTMSCWSMQQSKVLTSAGEGGVLVTDDVELANVARSVGDHGKQKPPASRRDGELQPGAGGQQLPHVGDARRLWARPDQEGGVDSGGEKVARRVSR